MTLNLDLIYGVYGSESMYEESHEVAHILSYQITIPESLFLREGLAMYFDGVGIGKNDRAAARIQPEHPEIFNSGSCG